MGQVVVAAFALPDRPLDAAAHFYEKHMPHIRELLQDGGPQDLPGGPAGEIDAVAFVFPAAGKDHFGWRLAAVQELAREASPKRVNGVSGDDQDAVGKVIDWLAGALGVTGQLLAVD